MENTKKKIKEMIESGNIEGAIHALDDMHASRAYLVIKDLRAHHIAKIKNSKQELYQLFQAIKIEAKESWDYDHKPATMSDVNKACTNVYTIMLRLMNVQNTQHNEEVNKIQSAINRIEKKLGIEPTVWEDEQPSDIDGGNDNVNDVQRIEENI